MIVEDHHTFGARSQLAPEVLQEQHKILRVRRRREHVVESATDAAAEGAVDRLVRVSAVRIAHVDRCAGGLPHFVVNAHPQVKCRLHQSHRRRRRTYLVYVEDVLVLRNARRQPSAKFSSFGRHGRLEQRAARHFLRLAKRDSISAVQCVQLLRGQLQSELVLDEWKPAHQAEMRPAPEKANKDQLQLDFLGNFRFPTTPAWNRSTIGYWLENGC